MNRTFEKSIPLIVAVIGAGASFCLGLRELPHHPNLLNAGLTIGAILVGFQSTALAILASAKNRIMRQLRETGFSKLLIADIRRSITWGMGLITVCVIGFFLNCDLPAWLHTVHACVWAGSALGVAASFYHVSKSIAAIIEE